MEVLEVQRGTLQIGQVVMGANILSIKDGAEEDTFIVELPDDEMRYGEAGGPLGTYMLSQPATGIKVHEDVQLGGFSYGPFRSLFNHRTKDDMAMEFTDFLTQRLGGEVNYAHNHEDRGVLASSLPAIHAHINIDTTFAQRWMNHMDETLEELEEDIDQETQRKLRNFFKYTVYYLVVCSQIQNEMAGSKTYDAPMNEKYTCIYNRKQKK